MQHKPNIYQANACPPCPPSASLFEKGVYWLGVGLGSGLPRRAAGTWGTLGGLIVAVPMMWLGFWAFLAITLVGCAIGSYVCGKTSKLMGVHDDPHIVFDEWVGIWIALLPSVWRLNDFVSSPTANLDKLHPITIVLFIIPFVLFRFFDIVKPFPISWTDKKVSGGFGILLDDILAGIMSATAFIAITALFF